MTPPDRTDLSTDGSRRWLKPGLLCAAALAVNLLFLGPQLFTKPLLSARYSGVTDFRHFYVGATLARDPYDRALAVETQRRLFPIVDLNITLNRLPFYYALLSPMSKFSPEAAHVLWLASLLLAAILAAVVWPFDRFRFALALCLSQPLAVSLITEQDLAFLLLIVAAGERLRVSRRPFLAGVVFSLALIKWHFFIFLPVMLLIRRESRLFMGFASGSVALVVASFVDAGLSWPLRYLAVLRGELRFGSAGEWVTVHAIALHFSGGAVLEVVLSALVVAGAGMAIWWAKSFEYALAVALLGGLLLGRHAGVWDCTVILPALTLLAARAGLVEAVATALLLPPVYILSRADEAWMIAVALLILLAAMVRESLIGRGVPADPQYL